MIRQKREESSQVVLLSAGLDSAYNLLRAKLEGKVLLALTFDYGQRAAKAEVKASRSLCEHLGVSHEVIALPWFQKFSKSALTAQEADLPKAKEVVIQDLEISKMTASRVWVPNRNGIFLNIAAGFAEGLGANRVIAGFNLEEAKTFDDNSKGFVEAANKSFEFSTANHVQVVSYSIEMEKPQILKSYLDLGGQRDWLWPCYEGFDEWCGVCESCQRFLVAEAVCLNSSIT